MGVCLFGYVTSDDDDDDDESFRTTEMWLSVLQSHVAVRIIGSTSHDVSVRERVSA